MVAQNEVVLACADSRVAQIGQQIQERDMGSMKLRWK
jgi:hypothetical protein